MVFIFITPKNHQRQSKKKVLQRGINLRKQRLSEITKEEKKISFELFKRYFGYSNPSYMYKALNETKNSEGNKTQVNIIENRLANVIEVLKTSPTSDVKKIKNRNNLLEIVERILFFNQLNQLGKGLKILTPNQMLNRVPISLAQLKAGNNSKNSKMKLGKYCILCADQKS